MFITSRRVSRLLPLLVSLLACAPFLSGCGMAVRMAMQAAQNAAQNASRSASNAPDTAYVASLQPLPSGPGLVVLEPVPARSASALAAWGTGASRWLQLHAAGQGEFGKTPIWQMLANIQRDQKRSDLRLSGEKALRAGHLAGVTHIAVGDVTGTAAQTTLHYQLLDIATKKKIADWKITAPLAQMPTKLPGLARQMAQKLGSKSPQFPIRLALTSDELAFLGSQPLGLGYRQRFPAPQANRIQALASKEALAGLMAQRLTSFATTARWRSVAQTLVKQAPRNPLVWSEIADTGQERLRTLHTGLEALSKQYPNNYLLAMTRMKFEEGNANHLLEVKWAETAVRAAPGNFVAWYDLANAQANTAGAIRQSKYSRDMTAAQRRQVYAIYPRAEAAAIKATQVNPAESHMWGQLAIAATFNSDEARADDALQKAITLDPGNGNAWRWGMQMTQPKWGGTMAGYTAFAMQAAQHADKFEYNATDASYVFSNFGKHADLKPILETVVKKDPQNVSALMELGAIYHYEDRSYKKAETLYRQALAINPNDSRSNAGLGDLTYWVHHDIPGAEALYLKAIASNPSDGWAHANLGRFYALTGRQAKGVAEAQKCKALGFSDTTHQVWQATGVTPP